MAEPVGDVETAHAVMTEADDIVIDVELLQIGGNRAHGDEHGAFDAAEGVFVGSRTSTRRNLSPRSRRCLTSTTVISRSFIKAPKRNL